ncbi:glycosyltransferase family 1 protein [Bacillus sp. AFS006103]|nr:glycosyltransferase family 1 protein [Bacillus sp. AFS006103]
MKKVLFTATVDSHILHFHIPHLRYFKENGYEVHVASNGSSIIPFVDKKHNLQFERSPFKIGNIKAYRELKKIILSNDFALVHCHTPMGGVVTRLVTKTKRKTGTKVAYTAHGFHFFKGASLINWMIYYPIEKWLSKYTDCLITINEEDYQRALNRRFQANLIRKVNGVGVDLRTFCPVAPGEKSLLRKENNLHDDDFILVYCAELNHNKHQDLLINTVNLLKDKIPNLKLLLAGEGSLKEYYKEQVENFGLVDKIQFLGYRKDMPHIFKLADVAVSASRREGLPVNIMEAMATGLPLVVSNCRGNRDLVVDGQNGYVIGVDDAEGFANALEGLNVSIEKRRELGNRSIELVYKFSIEPVMEELTNVYNEVLKEEEINLITGPDKSFSFH